MDIRTSSSSACERLVRTHDPDRYLISMFYPPETRAHLWALCAFNYEIARTRELVTDTHMGLIRLQWWRDCLTRFYENNIVERHDVMDGIANAVWRYNLPRTLFENIIYGREFDLEDKQPGSLEGLCNYADYTHAPLLRLCVMAAEEDQDDPALHPVAIAYTLAGIIRAVPFHMAQGRCFLPEDLMRRAGLDPDMLRQSRDRRGATTPIITAIREKAEDLLRQTHHAQPGRMVRLHRMMTEQYLGRIKRHYDNCYDARLVRPSAFRTIGLWREAGRKAG